MLRSAALISCLVLAQLISANPVVIQDSPIRLPFVKRVNESNLKNILQNDLARVANLRAKGDSKRTGADKRAAATAVNVPAQTENLPIGYITGVQIGNDPTTYELIVDTGSSNTWVGAREAPKSTTSKDTGSEMFVSYGSGSFVGEAFTDTFKVGESLTIQNQMFGIATTSEGFQNVDGIIGLGPVDLTMDTMDDPSQEVPTVTDNLFSQKVIPQHMVAVSFEPISETNTVNGEVTFGGMDNSKFTGSITFVPLTSRESASFWWGFEESITYGNSKTAILSSTVGIVDTGTTLILIASDAFARYTAATGAVLDDATGFLKVTPAQFANLQSMNFEIGGTTFELTANAQAWPRSLNTAIGGDTDSVYLIVNNIGSPTGLGFDFVNGQSFLERFYSVYDTTNNRVGFATTSFTTATTN